MFNLLHSNTNKKLFEKHLCNRDLPIKLIILPIMLNIYLYLSSHVFLVNILYIGKQ